MYSLLNVSELPYLCTTHIYIYHVDVFFKEKMTCDHFLMLLQLEELKNSKVAAATCNEDANGVAVKDEL